MNNESILDEATSALPAWAGTSMIAVLVAVLVGRAVFLSRRQLDRQLSWLLFWWLAAALLREPSVQSFLGARGIGLADIRLATHACALGGAVAIGLIVATWGNLRRIRATTIVPLYLGWAVWVVALAWVSEPARTAGTAVEALASWRTAVYFLLYAIPMPVVLFGVMVACFRVARSREGALESRILAALALVCAGISVIDHVSRGVNGVFLALGRHNWLTEWRASSNDVMFLPTATVLALVIAVPVIPAIRNRLGRDEDSRTVRRLEPMWQDITSRMPAISLESTSVMPSSAERAHRMLIECEDGIGWILPYMDCPATNSGCEPEEVVAAIQKALGAWASADANSVDAAPTAPGRLPEWLTDETELLRVADAWSTRTPAGAALP